MPFTYLNNVTATSLAGSGTGLSNVPTGVPIGTIVQSPKQPNASYLKADGTIYTQAAYPDLYAALGQLPQPGQLAHSQRGGVRFEVVNSLLFMLSDSPFISYSSDGGVTWTHIDPALTAMTAISGVAYTGSRYVIHSANNVAYSTNLTSWTLASTLPANNGTGTTIWNKILWDGAQLVLFGASYTSVSTFPYTPRVSTSPDGTTWTTTASIGPHTYPYSATAFSGSRYVVVQDTTTANNISHAATPTGTWTSVYFAGAGSVAWSSTLSLFVLTALGAVYTSADGLTWTQQTSGYPASGTGVGAVWTGSKFLVIIPDGDYPKIVSSTNGTSWAEEVDLSPLVNVSSPTAVPSNVAVHSGNYWISATASGTAPAWTVMGQSWNTGTHFRVPQLRNVYESNFWVKALPG